MIADAWVNNHLVLPLRTVLRSYLNAGPRKLLYYHLFKSLPPIELRRALGTFQPFYLFLLLDDLFLPSLTPLAVLSTTLSLVDVLSLLSLPSRLAILVPSLVRPTTASTDS